MNLKRSSGILATGAIALALIGTGVGAAITDHYSGTQAATVTLTPPPAVLYVTSTSPGKVIDYAAKTVTFAPYAITTIDSPPLTGGSGPQSIQDFFYVSSTGTGPLTVSATVTSTLPQAELDKFTLTNDGSVFHLGAAPTVIATQTTGQPQSMFVTAVIDWAGLTQAASGQTLTVTYSIDAS